MNDPEARFAQLEERLKALEKRIDELDRRTAGMRRVGPTPRPYEFTPPHRINLTEILKQAPTPDE